MTRTSGGGDSPRGASSRTGFLVSLVFGLLLIILGGLLLIGQLLRVDLGRVLWPFFIIGPGVALFVVALAMRETVGEGLAILGGVITMVGLILLFQNVTSLWATWAYAWALVAPTSIGLSQFAYGALKGRRASVSAGLRLAGTGLTIFVLAGAFFELILGISGFGLGPLALPLLLIGLGLVTLVGSLVRAMRSR